MARNETSLVVKPKSKAFEGVTPEKYASMLSAFISLPNPSITEICAAAGVGRAMVKRALTEGWPHLGLPPLGDATDALVDPGAVHILMSGMADQKATIHKNLFAPLKKKGLEGEALEKEAQAEAAARAAESGMAARVAQSAAGLAARSVEAFAKELMKMIENGDVELPEKVRLEHLYLLTKTADIAANAVHKTIQTEKLTNGQPEAMAGANIAALIIGATVEEMEAIARTGILPPRLMGFAADPGPTHKNVIDVEPVEAGATKPVEAEVPQTMPPLTDDE